MSKLKRRWACYSSQAQVEQRARRRHAGHQHDGQRRVGVADEMCRLPSSALPLPLVNTRKGYGRQGHD
jgi:hypothetical protein